MKLCESDLDLLKQNPGGIYCIAIKDSVWQAQLEADGDHDESSAYPKCYIGQAGSTRGIRARISAHSRKLRNGKHENSNLQRAWAKYGESAFECFVIESCPDESLDARENFWMWIHNAQGRHGFNISIHASAPMRGRKLSDEARAKTSAAAKRRYEDPEQRAKTGAAIKLAKQAPEARANNSEAQRLRFADPGQRAKMSAAIKLAKQAPEARAKASAATKRQWENPERRAKFSANNPMKNPEFAAKRAASRRANKERKRREMILANLAIIVEPQAQNAA